MISPAPIYPSGLRPVAVAGAGVQFATGLRLTSWVNEGSAGLGSGGLTMQNRNRQGGSVAFNFHGAPRPAMARMGRAWIGMAIRLTHGTGGNFSGLAIASLGWARQCSAGRGNNATRGDMAGQFSMAGRGKPGLVMVWQQRELGAVSKRNFTRPRVARRGGSGLGAATRYQERNLGQFPRPSSTRHGRTWRGDNVTGDGNPGHFPKHQEAPASRGATVDGMTGSV